ncbi:MAG: regulatory protein GemA [Proteobacteria bacterium]|nr:regulatory protein GemA [Pseudomonadota bacterium]MBU4132724.1 regulatory protein GemA [Pseudomonadota bacterium]
MISNKKKAVIHIAKAQVGMKEAEYRDLLSSVGAETSKDLTDKTFDRLMGQFQRLGFKTTSKTRSKRNVSNLPHGKKALMKKLEAIILDMGLTWGYVDAIAKKRFEVETAQWLGPEDLLKLVQMMVTHQNRQHKKERKLENT